jgi:hypothetical protein
MGTTTNLSLPYPDATLPIGEANEHIQQLAEALDGDLEHLHHYAQLARITTQNIPNSTAVVVQWTSADSVLTSDFDLVTGSSTDDTLKYLGPPRFGVFQVIIKWPAGITNDHATILLSRNDVTPTLGTDKYLFYERNFTDPHLPSGIPQVESGLVFMDTNAEWQVQVDHDTGATRAIEARLAFKAI